MSWWEFYYTHYFNKFLKTELQTLCKEYNIDMNQNKSILIDELVKQFLPSNNIEILKSNNNDYFYTQSRTSEYLQSN